MTLDSRTGTDLPTPPGIAPYLVSGFTGIGVSPASDDLMAFPTAG
ncbi:hypothetical protein [Streptomyces sp. NPDC001568]